MNWTSAGEFFAMGGYGLYVWGAYAMTLLCMALDARFAARRHRLALRDVQFALDGDGDRTPPRSTLREVPAPTSLASLRTAEQAAR
jgi:heme exporter protein D